MTKTEVLDNYKLNVNNSYVKILVDLFDRIINVDFQEEKLKKKVLVQ